MRRIWLLLLAVAFVSSSWAIAQPVQDDPRLIVARSTDFKAAIDGSKRQQKVEVNPTLIQRFFDLAQKASADGNLQPSPEVSANLFETGQAAVFPGRIAWAAVRGDQTVILRGTLDGVPDGNIRMIIHKGLLSVNIEANDAVYRIRPSEDDSYIVEEIGEEQELEPDQVGLAVPPGARSPQPGFEPSSADDLPLIEDGSRVDVLILYTTIAKNMAGGARKVELAAQETEEFLNESFARSFVQGTPPLRVRVMTEEIPDGVTSNIYTMHKSQTITARREARKADLVVVFHHQERSANGRRYAGNALVYCGHPKYGSKHPFAYVWANRISWLYTPSHEIGHLFGAQHNPESTSRDRCRWVPEALGHYFDVRGKRYGTVMSYKGSRIPHFSNPEITYRGVATGKAGERNNVRAILASRRTLANYRVSEDRPSENGPIIEVLRPTDNGSLPANSKINVVARIVDSDGVSAVSLHWGRTGRDLACPGTNNKDWECTQQGDEFTWKIDVGPAGPRTYRLQARDNAGNQSVTPTRTVRIIEGGGQGPLISISKPEDKAVIPPRSKLEISARIADGDGVAEANLFWEKTGSHLSCPGSDRKTWSCTKTGDNYSWTIDIQGPGTRFYRLHATDAAGNETISPDRSLQVR